jgi:hypothetical protein
MKSEFEMFISKTGQPEWQRYQIQNNKNMFWDGKKWVKDKINGELYYHYGEASSAIKQIEKSLNADKPVVRYEIPVICEVIGENPLDIEQLIDYLSRGTRFNLTLPNPEGLVIQLQMNVNAIKEIKIEPTNSIKN